MYVSFIIAVGCSPGHTKILCQEYAGRSSAGKFDSVREFHCCIICSYPGSIKNGVTEGASSNSPWTTGEGFPIVTSGILSNYTRQLL